MCTERATRPKLITRFHLGLYSSSYPGADEAPDRPGLVPDYRAALLAAARAVEEVDYFDLTDANRLEFSELSNESDAAQLRLVDFVLAHAADLTAAFQAAMSRTKGEGRGEQASRAHGRSERTVGAQRVPVPALRMRRRTDLGDG